MKRGFTLIELLVVIAIIAILAVVVVMTLNPAELLKQSRDSNRVSDMDTLAHAISLYQTDQGGSVGYTMGNASSVYISIPDATLSGNATSTCTSLNLPALSSGYTYQCTSPQSYKDVDGTGWIPINFSKMSAGVPLGSLPADPTNNTSTGLYYSYYTNGTQYEVTSLFESQKYKAQYAQNPLDTYYPEVNAKGSSLSISPLFNPTGLVGYWPMDEGTGTMAYDQSGNGNNGTWIGTPGGTSGYYSSGKVGNYAGYFNGNDNPMNLGTPSSLQVSRISVFAWVQKTMTGSYRRFFSNFTGGIINLGAFEMGDDGSHNIDCDVGTGPSTESWVATPINGIQLSTWYQVGCTYDGSVEIIWINGVAMASTTPSGNLYYGAGYPWFIGADGTSTAASGDYWGGPISDLRMYNRALSAAEVMALYNAGK